MCLSYFQLDVVIHYTPIQLGLSWVNHGLINVLTRCVYYGWHSVKLHPFNQFKWTPWEFELFWHSSILHDHCIVLFIIHWLYRATTSIAAPFCQFYAYMCVFFVRLCFEFLDHCDKLIWYQISWWDEAQISQKQGLWQILHEKLSKRSKFQHCTRSQGLPLNTLSKEIVGQACLINYARCEESLKCAGCLTLQFPFCCDLQVFNRWKHSLR